MVINREKQELRQKLLGQLLSLTKEEVKRRSKDVEDKLSSLGEYKQAKNIMVYYPLKGEVDILEMVRKDIKSKKFLFPVMDTKAKKLQAYEVENLNDQFVVGPYGVREPDTEKTQKFDIEKIDMVIVPGLSFDCNCNRLGRGAGFYDRFLQRLTPSTKKVGIAFDFQISQDLPTYLPLDQKVDIVVTESSII
ncbi:MAG: 5-formyltetrahydrofolate cyclo-ligase [Candidatus Omnitrophica bacterium]|nr:5-formyltetrahydrofolate cyclo-ligase [Candidatus Omnitrophota bacterium]